MIKITKKDKIDEKMTMAGGIFTYKSG